MTGIKGKLWCPECGETFAMVPEEILVRNKTRMVIPKRIKVYVHSITLGERLQ